jgi:hypothetical protein
MMATTTAETSPIFAELSVEENGSFTSALYGIIH